MLPKEEICTGCGACVNICAINAIKMEDSYLQFRIPVIDKDKCINCGRCEAICPVLNPRVVNVPNPKFFAFCADDEIRKVSSSGGIFTLLANYVFKRKGYVCGAAFDDKFQLSHQIIDLPSDLNLLRGSKYLQSDTNDCYKRIKQLLRKDEWVLFIGTPCQVAGLYAVLEKNYDKLITADLICHGTPSQKAFDNYLEEISAGKRVQTVNFRDKRLGWSCSNIVTRFEDSTEYIGSQRGSKTDPYVNAFMENIMMRKTCYDCKFSVYPRQGDFTIGDLWHSDKLDPESDDKKGTSFVFLNNEKAERIFLDITKYAKYVNEIMVEDYSKIPNRVYSKAREHPNRRRFLELLKKMPFSRAYFYAKKEIYDVGLLGYMCSNNIGSILTYYALYHVLTEMGYEILPIERPMDSAYELSPGAVEFFKKWLPAYAQPKQYKSIFDMRKLNNVCNKFVVGSDQLWLQSSSEGRNNYCFCQWADENKVKISYATSYGGIGARGTKEYYDELKYYLNKFYKVSCRENDGVNFANNSLKLKNRVELCLDPVFLANKSIYMKLIKAVNINRKADYIGGYVIKPKHGVYNLISKAKKHFGGISAEVLGEDKTKSMIEAWGFEYKNNFPVENALENIFNSKFFVTDSYHGACFCIIFKKDFLVIPRDFPDRFFTLFEKIGLEDRIIKNDHSDLKEKSFAPIKWSIVYEKLYVEIGISKHWLLDALKYGQKEFEYTDMDVIMEYIRKQDEDIQNLKREIAILKGI